MGIIQQSKHKSKLKSFFISSRNLVCEQERSCYQGREIVMFKWQLNDDKNGLLSSSRGFSAKPQHFHSVLMHLVLFSDALPLPSFHPCDWKVLQGALFPLSSKSGPKHQSPVGEVSAFSSGKIKNWPLG